MCPLCMTNAALIVAGAASGAGVVGFVAVKVRALRRHRRKPRTAQLIPRRVNNERVNSIVNVGTTEN
jgi:hypothetical protein